VPGCCSASSSLTNVQNARYTCPRSSLALGYGPPLVITKPTPYYLPREGSFPPTEPRSDAGARVHRIWTALIDQVSKLEFRLWDRGRLLAPAPCQLDRGGQSIRTVSAGSFVTNAGPLAHWSISSATMMDSRLRPPRFRAPLHAGNPAFEQGDRSANVEPLDTHPACTFYGKPSNASLSLFTDVMPESSFCR